jgi:hypothetical protein
MQAIVVYESHWGNTAAVARAIADGFGPGASVLTTDQATPAAIAHADLIVAGAPVIAFGLASDKARQRLAEDSRDAPRPPDVSHPSMRSWLKNLPPGHGRSAVFETRIWWSPRGATGTIQRGLEDAGYRRIEKGQPFVVSDTYGPLRDGELARARAWGEELARAIGA